MSRVRRDARSEKSQQADFYLDTWRRAARQINATVETTDGELLCISRGGATAKVYRNYTDLDGPVTLRAAGNKPLVHEMLRACGVPTPDFLSFSVANLAAAEGFLRLQGECVVKPAAATGAGAGVTTGVKTRRQLRRAAIRAAGFGPELLIEKQVSGKNVRLLFLDGQLLDAVERRPPSVVGDGRSTVAQLVREANRQRREHGADVAQVFLRYDLDMHHTLSAQRLAWRDVPADGQCVRLKTVINDNSAADNHAVADVLCRELVETGRRAAQAVGVRLAGVDIVTPDLTVDLSTAGGVVLEINTTPGLYIHKNKQGASVAVPILEACLEQAHKMYVGRINAIHSLAASQGPTYASSR
jgi:cyanophycin synthetase